MTTKKELYIFLILLLVLIGGGFVIRMLDTGVTVDGFTSCVEAGGTVEEVVPEKCFYKKSVYVNATDSFPIAVDDFISCVDAGNPVMESYPRQCAHNGVTYVENIRDGGSVGGDAKVTICPVRGDGMAVMCTQEYAPVCGLVQVQCITTPCDPVEETFSNACHACGNQNVISYTEGQCTK